MRISMKCVNVATARARLSSLLDRVRAGHDMIITRRGKPVARLTAVPAGSRRPFDLNALRSYLTAEHTRQCRRGPTVARMRTLDVL